MSWEAGLARGLRMTLTVVGIAVAAVLGLKVLVLLLEPHATFLPPPPSGLTPASIGLPFEEARPETTDGLRIHGWFIPGRGRAALTLLYFHGNAEDIGACLPVARLARSAGYNTLLVDYRGYGRSEGRPSEVGIYRDGEAALGYLRGRPDIDPGRIVLWGRSIGAAVAVRLAATGPPPAGIILESPFTSARELLREGNYWVLYAASLFGSYRFDLAASMRRVTAPVLVVHGTEDEVVPFRLGRRLCDLSPGRKEFAAIPGGGHNNLMTVHGDELWGAVKRFLATIE